VLLASGIARIFLGLITFLALKIENLVSKMMQNSVIRYPCPSAYTPTACHFTHNTIKTQKKVV